MPDLGRATFDLEVDANPFQHGLDQAKSSAERFAQTTERRFHALASAFGVITTAMLGSLEEFYRRGLKVSEFFETTTARFKTFIGSAVQASAHMKQVVALSLGTVFSTESIAQASLQLRKLGGAQLDNIKNLTAFSKAAEATGNDITSVATRFGFFYSMLQRGGTNSAYAIRSLQRAGLVTGEVAANIQALVQAGKLLAKDQPVPAALEKRVTAVAKATGMGTGELMKMAKAGNIAGAQWNYLLASLGRFNSASKDLLNTSEGLSAQIHNFLAEAQREVVAGLFESIKHFKRALVDLMHSPVWKDIVGGLKNLADHTAKLFDKAANIIEHVASRTRASGLVGYVQEMAHGLKTVLPILTAVGVGFSRDWLSKVPGVATIAHLLPGPFTAAFAAILLTSKDAREQLMGIFTDITKGLAGAFDQIRPSLSALGDTLSHDLLPAVVSLIRDGVNALLPVIPTVIDMFTKLVGVASRIAGIMVDRLKPILPDVAKAFADILKNLVPLIDAVIQLAANIAPPLVQAVGSLIHWAVDLVKALGPVVPLLIAIVASMKALSVAQEALMGIKGAIGLGLAGRAAQGGGIVQAAAGAGGIFGTFKKGFQAARGTGAAQSSLRMLGTTAEGALPAVGGLFAGLKGGFSSLLASINPVTAVMGALAIAVGTALFVFSRVKQDQQKAGQQTLGSLTGGGAFGGLTKGRVDLSKGVNVAGSNTLGNRLAGMLGPLQSLFGGSAMDQVTKNWQIISKATEKYNAGLITADGWIKEIARATHTTVEEIKRQVTAGLQNRAALALSSRDWKGMNGLAKEYGNALKRNIIDQKTYNDFIQTQYMGLLQIRNAEELSRHDFNGFIKDLLTALPHMQGGITEFANDIKNAGLGAAELKRVLDLIPRSIKTTLDFQIVMNPGAAIATLKAMNKALQRQYEQLVKNMEILGPPGVAGANIQAEIRANQELITNLQAAIKDANAATYNPPPATFPTTPPPGSADKKKKKKSGAPKPVAETPLAKAQLADASKAYRKLGGILYDALIDGFRKGYDKAIKALGLFTSSLAKMFGGSFARLQQAIRDAVTQHKLPKAYQTMAANLVQQAKDIMVKAQKIQQQMKDMAASVKSGFQQSGDMVGKFGTESFVTPAQVRVFFQRRIADAKAFAQILKDLARKGLNKHMLQELASEGPDAIGLARALIQMPVKELNAYQAQITSLAKSTAGVVTTAAFSGDIAGLAKQAKALGKHIDEFIRALKASALKHHANAVLNALGAFASGIKAIMASLKTGLRSLGIKIPGLAAGGLVTAPTLAVIGEGHEPEAVLPISRLKMIIRDMVKAVWHAAAMDLRQPQHHPANFGAMVSALAKSLHAQVEPVKLGPIVSAMAKAQQHPAVDYVASGGKTGLAQQRTGTDDSPPPAQEVIHFHEVAQTPEEMLRALRWRRFTKGWN